MAARLHVWLQKMQERLFAIVWPPAAFCGRRRVVMCETLPPAVSRVVCRCRLPPWSCRLPLSFPVCRSMKNKGRGQENVRTEGEGGAGSVFWRSVCVRRPVGWFLFPYCVDRSFPRPGCVINVKPGAAEKMYKFWHPNLHPAVTTPWRELPLFACCVCHGTLNRISTGE